MKDNTKRVEIAFVATVNEDSVDELKRIVDHHLDWLIDLESFPEIKGISNAALIEHDDED